MTTGRPPRPPEDGVTLLRPPFDGAPGADDTPLDPEQTIDTQEISLAELRAAARIAGVDPDVEVPAEPSPAPDPQPEPEIVVDLVDAESAEADVAELPAPQLDPSEPVVDSVVEPGLEQDGTAAPIDPRINERRVAVTAAQLARRRKLALIGVGVASAVGILWLIVQAPFLSVQHVQIEGATRETRLAVERAAAVKSGSPLLFLDTGEVAQRVEALPWVAHASVSRDLPNGITIKVEERLPVAWTRRPAPVGAPPGALGPVAVVDVSGRVLGDEPQPPAGLPEIVGLPEVPERGAHISPRTPASALHALPDALRAQTAALVLRKGEAVLTLVAPPGGAPPAAGEVRLGRLDEVAQKGAAALAVLDQLTAGGEQVRYVDVRVPGAPATR